MSRIANTPVLIPDGVTVNIHDKMVVVKGKKGELAYQLAGLVELSQKDKSLYTVVNDGEKEDMVLAGTIRALLQNMVTGVNQGFERKLEIVGVGYRAQVQGKVLNLSLGFSHQVKFPIPEGINIETPSQTEIVVQGIDKQKVSQVAANIRYYRQPEPYKGKGIRYVGEHIVRKEAKKT